MRRVAMLLVNEWREVVQREVVETKGLASVDGQGAGFDDTAEEYDDWLRYVTVRVLIGVTAVDPEEFDHGDAKTGLFENLPSCGSLDRFAEFDCAAGESPNVTQLGLRTTAQMVDACNPDAATRAAILSQRRPHSYDLTHPVAGTITIRDQKPLKLRNLELTDVTVQGFLELLNTSVFMWTTLQRLSRLLGARPYRKSVHDVLVLDTARMVDAYSDNIRLTGMNTGATIFPTAPPRGAESFMSIVDFPFAERRRGRRPENTVVELCVIGGVDNVNDFVMRVERRRGADVIETIYER